MAYKLSIFPLNGNQETTQKYTYKKEIMSETNDTEEITDGNFLINLKLIYQYQNKDPILLAEYK